MATHDFLTAGYSVAWLSSQDFDDHQLNYDLVNEAFAADDGPGYSVRDYSPLRFIECESYRHAGEHNWGTVPAYVNTCDEEYEICTSCPCTLRRKYDEEVGEYIYNPESIMKPDLPLRVLKNTLVLRDARGTEDMKRMLTQRYMEGVLEKALADRPEIGECPGPKGFHEWTAPDLGWRRKSRTPAVPPLLSPSSRRPAWLS